MNWWKTLGKEKKIRDTSIFKLSHSVSKKKFFFSSGMLKVALQILGRKFYRNILRVKISSLHSQSLLIFIHKITQWSKTIEQQKLEIYYIPVDTEGKHGLFYMSILLIYLLEIHSQSFKIASDEDIIENNHMFVMLLNLSVTSYLIFPPCRFFISGAKSKHDLRGYVAF